VLPNQPRPIGARYLRFSESPIEHHAPQRITVADSGRFTLSTQRLVTRCRSEPGRAISSALRVVIHEFLPMWGGRSPRLATQAEITVPPLRAGSSADADGDRRHRSWTRGSCDI